MKKVLWALLALLGLVVVAAIGGVLYFKAAAQAKLDQTFEIEVEPIPLPYPLNSDERGELTRILDAQRAPSQPATDTPAAEAAPGGTEPSAAPAPSAAAPDAPAPSAAAPDAAAPTASADPPSAAAPPEAPAAKPAGKMEGAEYRAEALRRGIARGKNYLASRAGCADCHGADFGGKVIVENPAMGKWISPNITTHGVTKDYASEDWVRLIRHGVKPDGHPAVMPCQDFTWFSDQELSDIVVYLKSVPPVDRVMPPIDLGPIFSMLIATGQFPLGAEILDHTTARAKLPPALEATVELGQHLGTTCVGCHGPNLSGGPIVGGDPSWPPAANLTFDDTGLAGYTLADFNKTLIQGISKNGKKLHPAMPIALTGNMKDVEREALYTYLKTLPKVAKGAR